MSSDASFDPSWVAAAACRSDPSLDPEVAEALAVRAWAALQEVGELDAPAVSRLLISRESGIGVSESNAVAMACVAFCEETGLRPGRP